MQMIAEILSVGTELLMGQIANTDAQFISRRLGELGVTIYRHSTVGDNPARVREALQEALSRSDMVITTGGLGPTEDDLTKEMVAEALGLPMVRHDAVVEGIRRYFESTGREMTPNNLRQADFPEGARLMPNRKGTAPGCIAEKDGKRVAVLPGPPHELIDMYEQQLEPYLLSLSDQVIASRFLHIVGVGESIVETRLMDLFHWESPTLALYCAPGEVTARLTVRCGKDVDPAPLLEPLEKEIRARLGESVYAEGLDASMPKTVVEMLAARKETVSVAESLTGGMLASRLVDVPGASAVLGESYVTYANEAKERLLGVSGETLRAHGAVSEQCAREMAEGCRRASGADWALATTGIAGPDGGTPEKPVGTVYIACAGRQGVVVKALKLRGDRTRVRSMTCLYAMDLLRVSMKNTKE